MSTSDDMKRVSKALFVCCIFGRTYNVKLRDNHRKGIRRWTECAISADLVRNIIHT